MDAYHFQYQDPDAQQEEGLTVDQRFHTDYLGTLLEKIFWFLRAAGWGYITRIIVVKEGGGTDEFGVD
jgi:hypothetical protein